MRPSKPYKPYVRAEKKTLEQIDTTNRRLNRRAAAAAAAAAAADDGLPPPLSPSLSSFPSSSLLFPPPPSSSALLKSVRQYSGSSWAQPLPRLTALPVGRRGRAQSRAR